MTPAAARE